MSDQKKKVDISQFLDEDKQSETEPLFEEESQKDTEEVTQDTEGLLKYLKQYDPTTAMLAAHVFHQGNLLNDVIQKMHQLEHHVGYLLSKDPDVAQKMKEKEEHKGDATELNQANKES